MEVSNLSNKSEQNRISSELLFDKGLYASSIHCSYYAVFQFMTCKLSECLNIGFDTITQNSKSKGSHKYVIEELIKNIKTKELSVDMDMVEKNVKSTNIQKLKSKINDLKSFRVQSDYHNIEINDIKSNKSLELSKEIVKKLKIYMP